MRWRSGAYLAGIAIAAIAYLLLSWTPALDGLSVDALFWLRERIMPATHDRAASPTVVIAIDEETYRREPFKTLPQALWAPEIGKVLEAVLSSGAAVVGFDIVYSTSVEPLFNGYEQDLLLALRRGGREGRVVLGQLQHQEAPISPFGGYIFAVGGSQNVRPLNLIADPDGIVRRLPLSFESDQGPVKSMAAELAWRAARVPGPSDPVLLNFDRAPRAIPTYSLADLHACGDRTFLENHFKDKIVLLGVVLDVEDRKLASNRFITGPESAAPDRCATQPMNDLYRPDLRRDTIPGAYIHATAVNNLIRDNALKPLPAVYGRVIGAIASATIMIMALRLGLISAATALGLFLTAWTGASLIAFDRQIVFGWLATSAMAVFSFILITFYRHALVDRGRRQIRRAFGLYLPPSLIDKMMAQDRLPQLGGELRAVTVLFTDIEGFTTMSERHDPKVLVDEVNVYFDAMTKIIVNEHQGFVERYIGDAVLAIFGAPLEDADHARHAVEAALRMQGLLAERQFCVGGRPIRARIGINTGEALVGNIGSSLHFSYTAMGDAVNLASRIENANKQFGTKVLVSDATMRACGGSFVFRRIATVQVAGRDEPVTLFEPRTDARAT